MLGQASVFTIVLTIATAQIQVPASESDPGQQIIRVGSTYYTPLYAVTNNFQVLQPAESAALGVVRNPLLDFSKLGVKGEQGYKYEPPKRGYTYPVPTTTSTRPPPLAEQNPAYEEDRYATERAPATKPDRVAEYPTTSEPIGIETDQEIESVGITPAPRPRPVHDRPSFEISTDQECPDDTPNSWPCGYRTTIPGVEGVDYPIYTKVPKTSFRCIDFDHSGYFADVEARCQAFHVCLRRDTNTKKYSFLCPNGTVFSQQEFACTWWNEAPECSNSPDYYNLNNGLNWDEINERTMMRMATIRIRPTLPPLAVRVKQNTAPIGANLVQVQRSKAYVTGKASSKSQSLTKLERGFSDSEAYEDKSIPAEGFIVNRRPGGNSLNSQSDRYDGVAQSPSTPTRAPATTFLPRRTTTELPPPAEVQDYDYDFTQANTNPPTPTTPAPTTSSRPTYGPPNYTPPEPAFTSSQRTETPELSFNEDFTAATQQDFFGTSSRTTVGEFRTTTAALPSPTTPRPKLNYKASTSSNFKSEDSDTIDEILRNTNIVDNLPNGVQFSGFGSLGTQTQIFNSNIRDLLKSKGKVQEVRPEYVEIVKGNGSEVNGVEPVRAFLSSQQGLNDKQTLEIHEFENQRLQAQPNSAQSAEPENELPRESLYKEGVAGVEKAKSIQAQQAVPAAPQPFPQFQPIMPQFFQPVFQVHQQLPPQFQQQLPPQLQRQHAQFLQPQLLQPQFAAPQYLPPAQQPPPQPQPQQPAQPQQQITNQYLPPAAPGAPQPAGNPVGNAQPQPNPPPQNSEQAAPPPPPQPQQQQYPLPQFTQMLPIPQYQVFSPQYTQIIPTAQPQLLQPYAPPPTQAFYPPAHADPTPGAPESDVTHHHDDGEYSPPPSSSPPEYFSGSSSPEQYPVSGSSSSSSAGFESFSPQSAPQRPSYTSSSYYSPPTRPKSNGYFGPIRNLFKTAFGPSKPQYQSRPPSSFFSSGPQFQSRPTYLPPRSQYKSPSDYSSSSTSYSSGPSAFGTSGSDGDFSDQFIDQSVSRPVVVNPSGATPGAVERLEVVPAMGLHLKTIVSGHSGSGVLSSALAAAAEQQNENLETQEFAESANNFRVTQPLQIYNQQNIPAARLEIFLPCQTGPNKICANDGRSALIPQAPAAKYQPTLPLQSTPLKLQHFAQPTVYQPKFATYQQTSASIQQPAASYQPQTWTKITPLPNGQGYKNSASLLLPAPTQITPSYKSLHASVNHLHHNPSTHYDRTKAFVPQRDQPSHYNGSKVNHPLISQQQPATMLRHIATYSKDAAPTTYRDSVPVHNAATRQQQENQGSYGFKSNH